MASWGFGFGCGSERLDGTYNAANARTIGVTCRALATASRGGGENALAVLPCKKSGREEVTLSYSNISAPPQRSLRLCGATFCSSTQNRRDAENAEETQRGNLTSQLS